MAVENLPLLRLLRTSIILSNTNRILSRLLLPQTRIATFNGQQSLMGPTLRNLPIMQNNNIVRLGDSAEPMRDDEHRPAARQIRQSLLDLLLLLLRLRIKLSGDFVKEDDLGVLEDRLRDGDALFLAVA